MTCFLSLKKHKQKRSHPFPPPPNDCPRLPAFVEDGLRQFPRGDGAAEGHGAAQLGHGGWGDRRNKVGEAAWGESYFVMSVKEFAGLKRAKKSEVLFFFVL